MEQPFLCRILSLQREYRCEPCDLGGVPENGSSSQWIPSGLHANVHATAILILHIVN